MARTQSKNYPEVRESILKAAAKLFAARGYANSSILDLADACGSSRGALYHYFQSKEQILSEILVGHLDAVLEGLQAAAAAESKPRPRLRGLARRLMAMNASHQAEQTTLLNEVNQLDDGARALAARKQREIVDLFVDALSQLDAHGRMSIGRRKAYAMMFLGALNYTYVWYHPAGRVTPEDYADMTVDAFVDGLAGPARGLGVPRRQTRNESV